MADENDITDEDIASLRSAAGSAGDSMQVALCDLAEHGDVEPAHYRLLSDEEREELKTFDRTRARKACAEVILDARSPHAEHAEGGAR